MAGVQADAEPLAAAGAARSARASSSNERPSVPPAPAVSSRCSGQLSDSSSASTITSPARSIAGPTSPPSFSAEPGCSTTPCAPSAAPACSAVVSAVERLVADLRVLGGAVEQVDGVDQQRVDVESADRLVERGDLLLGVVLARPPRARALVEDLDRPAAALVPRSTALAGPPAGETWAPISMLARVLACCVQHARPLRPVADRRPAHRRRADGAVQLAARARPRRRAGAAHRGHRPRALDARERRADLRGAALARARLGRRAVFQSAARRPPRRGRRAAARRAATPTAPPPAPTRSRPTRRPRDDRGFRGEDEGAGAVRLRVPDEGATVVRDVIRGESDVRATRCWTTS